MHTLARLISACLLLSGTASAINAVSFRTLCFRYQDELKEVMVLGGDGESMIPVPLYTVYSLPGTMATTDGRAVFVIADGETPDGKPKYKTVASVKVPATKQVLFLFLPAGQESREPYKVVALSDDARSFPWGNVRMINLADVPVRFNLGEYSGAAAKVLKPGASDMVSRIRKVNRFNMYNVVIEFYGQKGFVPVSNTRWKSVDGKRDLAIAYVDPDTEQPLVNVYKDVRPAIAP